MERARDRLIADVELARSRVTELDVRIGHHVDEVGEILAERSAHLIERCTALEEHLKEWPQIEVGMASAIDDLGDAVDVLEADLGAIEESELPAYARAVDHQIRRWRGRAEQLQLKGALGNMELRDELEQITERLSDLRSGVLVDLRGVTDGAKDIVIDLRDDVEKVLAGVRDTIEHAVDKVTGRD